MAALPLSVSKIVSMRRKSAPPSQIRQSIYPVTLENKGPVLLEILKRPEVESAIVFTRTKSRADRVAKMLESFPEVKVADSVSGAIDLVVQLEVERIEDLNRVRDELARLPGVESTQTLLVMAPRFDRR